MFVELSVCVKKESMLVMRIEFVCCWSCKYFKWILLILDMDLKNRYEYFNWLEDNKNDYIFIKLVIVIWGKLNNLIELKWFMLYLLN